MSFKTWLIHGPAAARRENIDKVLRAMLAAGKPTSAFPLSRAAQVRSGSLYVALARLEELGLTTSAWEILPAGIDRPRHRLYELSEAGIAQARSLAA